MVPRRHSPPVIMYLLSPVALFRHVSSARSALSLILYCGVKSGVVKIVLICYFFSFLRLVHDEYLVLIFTCTISSLGLSGFLPSLDPFVTSTVTPRYLVKMDLIASVLYFSFLGLSQLSTPEHCELLR